MDSPDIDIHGLPQACVDDCKPVLNILPFGKCYTGRECETEMRNRWGHRIEVLSSGQDGIFARKILMIREMEKELSRAEKDFG